MSQTRYIDVQVYRNSGPDCTNKGISSTADRLYVIGVLDQTQGQHKASVLPPDCQAREFTADDPTVILLIRTVFGRIVHSLIPANPALAGVHWMMGGNYAASSDGRWNKLIDFYGAVAIHDRRE